MFWLKKSAKGPITGLTRKETENSGVLLCLPGVQEGPGRSEEDEPRVHLTCVYLACTDKAAFLTSRRKKDEVKGDRGAILEYTGVEMPPVLTTLICSDFVQASRARDPPTAALTSFYSKCARRMHFGFLLTWVWKDIKERAVSFKPALRRHNRS